MMRGDKTHYSTFGKIIGAMLPLPPPPATVTAVRGDEQLEFDGAWFKVIATPGHSPGSVMYLYKDVLFTGDSLMRKNDGVAIVPAPVLRGRRQEPRLAPGARAADVRQNRRRTRRGHVRRQGRSSRDSSQARDRARRHPPEDSQRLSCFVNPPSSNALLIGHARGACSSVRAG